MINYLRTLSLKSLFKFLSNERESALRFQNEFVNKVEAKGGKTIFHREWTDNERVAYWLGRRRAVEVIKILVEEGADI